MDDACGFGKHILHKTVQRMPLRSALNPPYYDLRALDYQMRKESPTLNRLSVYNVRKDFYAKQVVGPESQQPLTERIPPTHRRSEVYQSSRLFVTETTPPPVKRSESVLQMHPTESKPKVNTSASKPLLRSKSVHRISEIDSLRGFCTYVEGDISAHRERVHKMRHRFISRLRNCGHRLRKIIEKSTKGTVPPALLELKRKSKELRQSTMQRTKYPIETLEKQVVAEFKADSFAKASQSSLPMKLRYIYTLGSTSARDVRPASLHIAS